MSDYGRPPAGVRLDVQPFHVHVDDTKLEHFKKLLELSPIAPAVFENTNAARKYGMKRDWLEHAKDVWLNEFDWRAYETKVNSVPNFKTFVKDSEGNDINIHFLALFSERPDAIPITFFHGWPSSNCSFLDLLGILKEKYTPQTLPYHVIVPALPGYAFSSGPPVDTDYELEMAAEAMNNLMIGLGFGSGYLAQGGDLGSFVSRILAIKYDACKGMHLNMMVMPPQEDPNEVTTDELELKALERAAEFIDTGYAFVLEQSTRPATVGLALSASPIALLCWIGEKMLEWTDEDPPLNKILENVSLYWLTDTIPRSLWHNRAIGNPDEKPRMGRISGIAKQGMLRMPYVDKPCGYSSFAHDIIPAPKSWATKSCNLVFYKNHEHGGHFAPMEKPAELLADVEEYIKTAWIGH